MISDKDRDAAILEWETGYDADGNESRFAQWSDGDVGGIPTRVRKPPTVEMLRAMLRRPEHMVRCDVDATGRVVIEIEERDEMAPSKGAGSPTVYAHDPTDKARVRFRNMTIAKIVEVGTIKANRLAAIAAKEAAFTIEQQTAKIAYEQAKADMAEAEKVAAALGVFDSPLDVELAPVLEVPDGDAR